MNGACDCHVQIYDPRFPMAWPDRRAVADASVAQYRGVEQRLGTTRAIVVQPAAYGTDNAVTLDAIAQLGSANGRGIAVVHPSVSDMALTRLEVGGIRGLRFTLDDPKAGATSADTIEPLARRIAPKGWHVQLHFTAGQIVEMEAMLTRLPATIVIDHMARLPQPEGAAHAALTVVRRLLDSGRAWIKLSGPYLDSLAQAPERCVWGSDWPHPTEEAKPDDAALFALLSDWTPDEATRRKILVENPAELYGFPMPR
jgi:predicted TIM-barrel fold metal-dependent hydrolase